VIVIREIVDVLIKEELRNKNLKKQYENEIANLPKGCFSANVLKSGTFYTFHYRENGKNKSKYIGRDKSAMQAQIDRRKHLLEEIQFIEYDLKALGKMKKIAEKQISNLDVRERLRKMRVAKSEDGEEVPPASTSPIHATSSISTQLSNRTPT